MRKLSILLLLGLVAPAHAQDGAARRQIILFGARWCAPCMGEYRELGAIVAAARPDRVVLAWTDRAIAAPLGMAAGQVDSMPAQEARALAEKLNGSGYGLPLSAVRDPEGRICAIWNAPLRAGDVARLLARCDRR